MSRYRRHCALNRWADPATRTRIPIPAIDRAAAARDGSAGARAQHARQGTTLQDMATAVLLQVVFQARLSTLSLDRTFARRLRRFCTHTSCPDRSARSSSHKAYWKASKRRLRSVDAMIPKYLMRQRTTSSRPWNATLSLVSCEQRHWAILFQSV